MSFEYKKGNLLTSNCEYICHQVNCQGVMGSGIAKQIRETYPYVYTQYLALKDKMSLKLMLGYIQIVPITATDYSKHVINMFAQEYYGYDKKQYTSYAAFYNCLVKIKRWVPKGATIGFPYRIGSDRGGANWDVIESMIKSLLEEDYTVEIYVWEGK